MCAERSPPFLDSAVDCLRSAAGEKSALTKSFWCGKFLQALPHKCLENCYLQLQHERVAASAGQLKAEDHVISHVLLGQELYLHVRDALESVRAWETSLSPNVFAIITTSVPKHLSGDENIPDFMYKDLTLNWQNITEYLGKDVLAERRDYAGGAMRCGAIAKQVHVRIAEVEPSLLRDTLGQHLWWTHSPRTFLCCVEVLLTAGPLSASLALLVGSAALERALGDIYLTVSKAGPCPSLLRDLLATRELEETFGPTAMCLLRCLIGPPSGLNLRNVLWHGFPSPSEVPLEYAYLLVVVVSSLGKLLLRVREREGWLGGMQHRAFLSFPQEPMMTAVFGGLNKPDLTTVEKLFSSSFFILPPMLPSWREALHAFSEERYGHFLVLMLPGLEHGLRRVFACVNSCPERAITAESTALYTTFDEILSPCLPGGAPNVLKEEIGVAKLEMLLDVLVHPDGPRLRDRVSHGEVDFLSISRVVATHLLSVAVVFCAHYCIGKDLKDVPFIVKCLEVESRYISLFHPISLLRRELEQLLSHLESWRAIPRPDYGEDSKGEGGEEGGGGGGERRGGGGGSEGVDTFLVAMQEVLGCVAHLTVPAAPPSVEQLRQLFHEGGGSPFSYLRDLVSMVWGRPLHTLFVARQELELTGVLRRAVENASQATVQIRKTALLRFEQCQQNELRSRQRRNYDHLLSSLQTYQAAMALLVILVAVTASHMPLELQNSRKIIRFQKRVLQFSENFSSQSSPARNRWEEADRLCLSLADLAPLIPLTPH